MSSKKLNYSKSVKPLGSTWKGIMLYAFYMDGRWQLVSSKNTSWIWLFQYGFHTVDTPTGKQHSWMNVWVNFLKFYSFFSSPRTELTYHADPFSYSLYMQTCDSVSPGSNWGIKSLLVILNSINLLWSFNLKLWSDHENSVSSYVIQSRKLLSHI